MTPRLRIGVLRSDDHLVLDFELVNLRLLVEGGGPPRLVQLDAAQPSYFFVHFPAQHIAEQAFFAAPGPETVARSVMANPSLLVFDVTAVIRADGQIPVTIDAFLSWERFVPVVEPLPAGESGERTAIEVPYRLLLSPDAEATWLHNRHPVPAAEGDVVWTELWQTRLATRPDDPDLPPRDPLPGERTVQVIAARHPDAPDPALGPAGGPGPIPSSEDRRQIPRDSPIPIERLALSSLGAWLSLHGRWETGGIEEWQQITSMGRDLFAKVVRRGYLYPFGHRAVVAAINERLLERAPDATDDVAYLKSRSFLTVVEPERDFGALAGSYPRGTQGREMPLRRVRILSLRTPEINIDPADHLPRVVTGGSLGDLFRFQLAGEDWDGNWANFSMPLAFVSQDELSSVSLVDLAVALDPHSEPALDGQPIAYAPSAPGDKTTTFPTASARFAGIGGVNALIPPFLPRVTTATASLPVVEQLLGSPRGMQPVRLLFSEAYLASGFDPGANAGQLFATFADPLRVGFPAEQAGGFLTPRPNFAALSRALGPVSAGADAASSVEDSLQELTAGTFNPTAFLGSVKILGTFALTDLVAQAVPYNVAELDAASAELRALTARIEELRKRGDAAAAAEIRELEATLLREVENPLKLIKVPMLTTHVHRDGGVPTAVEIEYLWKPQLVAPDGPSGERVIGDVLKINRDTRLLIRSTTLQRLGGGGPTARVYGVLSTFTLSLFGLLDVEFDRLTFDMEIGGSPKIVPKIRRVGFGGALAFVKQIAEKLIRDIPFDISLLPEAIVASYRVPLPGIAVGLFAIKNISLSTSMTLPLVEGGAIGTRFALSEKRNPFLVSIWWFGGGGFFAMEVRSDKLFTCELAIEAGAVVSLDVGVARGEVHAFFGIYLKLGPDEIILEGYFRVGGSVSVLAIASVSIEASIKLAYVSVNGQDVVRGEAMVELCVELLFFSKCVSFSIEKEFRQPPSLRAGGGVLAFPDIADTTDAFVMANRFSRSEWQTYTRAFA